MLLWVLVCMTCVVIALFFERREMQGVRLVFKALASTAFPVAAYVAGAFESFYGVAVFVGLALSWWGDVLLVSRARALFLTGLVAFLLAHVAYSAAFIAHGIKPAACLIAAVIAIGPVIVVLRYVLPHVASDMKVPVIAYMVVITAMVLLSAGAFGAGAHWALPVAAVVFFVSDVFVARDRFVAPGFDNAVLGLPLYYAAQLLFAYTIVLVA